MIMMMMMMRLVYLDGWMGWLSWWLTIHPSSHEMHVVGGGVPNQDATIYSTIAELLTKPPSPLWHTLSSLFISSRTKC